jgi:AcrR family transcriptional regulator
MEATARILETHGLEGLTTNKVAALAGVSIGSLYEYFDSKDALVRAWCERYVQRVREVIDALLDALEPLPLEDAVLPFLDGVFELNLGRQPFIRVLLDELPTVLGHHPLRDIDDHLAARWEASLRRKHADLPADLSLRLYALTRMGRTVTAAWVLEGRPAAEVPALKRALAGVITASLGRPAPR